MKLGEGGEAFFVFETEGSVPSYLVTSPVISPAASPINSPRSGSESPPALDSPSDTEPDFLDLEKTRSHSPTPISKSATLSDDTSSLSSAHNPYSGSHQFADSVPNISRPRSPTMTHEQAMERAQQLTKKLNTINIKSKVTDNGDVVMDMTGYKSSKAEVEESEEVVKRILAEEFGETNIDDLMKRDPEGHLRIFTSPEDVLGYGSDDGVGEDTLASTPQDSPHKLSHAATYPGAGGDASDDENENGKHVFAKTLRLTSDQLKSLNLNPGSNDVSFTVIQSKAQCTARMFYWKYDVPIVISDIDGTITKSDALGHVFAMIGRDWTHPGVGKLFTDIESNGYHIMYLTARSVGQADSTRYYLKGISQDGFKLPNGPVILSPDRTMAALKREVIMKKPEVFKMACLRDIKNLYGDLDETPFYAGFGNRITDALSYRSVGIPSSRIFTINPNGDVHLELLELSGYKSSYVSISDLVDHFFPPAGYFRGQETYTDLAYWKEPIPDLSELESTDDENNNNDTSSNDAMKSDSGRLSRKKEFGSNPAGNISGTSIPGSPKQRPISLYSPVSPTLGPLGSKSSSTGNDSDEESAAGVLAGTITATNALGLKTSNTFPSAYSSGGGTDQHLPGAELEQGQTASSYKKHNQPALEQHHGDDDGADHSSSNDYDEEGELYDEYGYEEREGGYGDEGDDEDEEDEEDDEQESEIGHGEYESDVEDEEYDNGEYDDDDDRESEIGHGEYESNVSDDQGDDYDNDSYSYEQHSKAGEQGEEEGRSVEYGNYVSRLKKDGEVVGVEEDDGYEEEEAGDVKVVVDHINSSNQKNKKKYKESNVRVIIDKSTTTDTNNKPNKGTPN